jgi:hypothetical protein
MRKIAKRTRKPDRKRNRNRRDRSRPLRNPALKAARRRATVQQRKPKRKLASPRIAKPPAHATPARDAQRVKEALDHLARAQAELTATGIDLLNVAHTIGHNAVTTFKQELVDSLVQDNLLQDLDQLRTDTAAIPLPANLKLLPEATINWLCRHLELSQHLHPGQELEVPTAQLSEYDLLGPSPDSAKALANLQVVAHGWKHRGQTVIRARVMVAARPLPPSANKPGG